MQQSKMRLFLTTTVFLTVVSPALAADAYLSPLAVVADSAGKTLYVAQSTAGKVAVVDVASGKVARDIAVEGPLSGMALSPEGDKLYVAQCVPAGRIRTIDLKTGKAAASIRAGHCPAGIVVSHDGKRLYVCSQFNNAITVIDLAASSVEGRIPVKREPIAAAITPDGKTLFVANHLPAGATDGDYAAAEVSVIDTESRKQVASLLLPNGSTALRDITISPDGQNAYVTHILARYQLPTTQLERGWMNTNALTIIDVPARKLVNTVLLDDVDLGAANPWSVRCTADGKHICVTLAGTHELCVIDRAKLHEKLAKAAAGEKVSDATSTPDDVPNDLSFLVLIKRRIRLEGNNPRGLALIGDKAYAAQYFTANLAVVDLNPDVRPKPQYVSLGAEPPMTAARKGEMFFHDASLCFQKWQSCSSCHPGNGRVDGLNWDLLNDGLGNPKNTKSMLLAHKTPPAMSLGVRADAEAAVRAGIRHIQFAVRPEEDAVAIDEYLKGLEAVPSPQLRRGALSESAERGKEVFQSAGCGSCHTPGLFTDLKEYDLGMGRYLDEGKAVDTPTLFECWRTAPYLHDGRAATIREVLTKFNKDDKHGKTSNLTDQQIKDLAAYVLSL